MLVTQVRASIEKHSMLVSGAKVVVAVSGGADSTALLSLLTQLQQPYNATLIVAHVNHQLRADEAEREALFVEQLAQHFGLAFYQTHIDVAALQRTSGLSLQQAARYLRYRYLERLCASTAATCVALGHTADDQAETLLLRLLRGSGPAGLAGMPIVRWPFIRPLLTVSRRAILQYLRTHCIAWVEDSSNAHPVYLRNRVRQQLIPILQQLNPRIMPRLANLADMMRADNAVLEQHVDAWQADSVEWQAEKVVDVHALSFRLAPLAIQRRLLRRILDQLLSPNVTINFQHIEALRSYVVAENHRHRLTLPGGFFAEYHGDTIRMRNLADRSALADSYALPIPGTVEIVALNIRIQAEVQEKPLAVEAEAYSASLARESLLAPLRVRFRQSGDRFYPLGSPGRKKLQDFYVDSRIPYGERPYVPLVVSGQDIVWVVGYRIAEPYKIRAETRQIIRLQCRMIRRPHHVY